MKRYLLLFVILISINGSAFCQWTQSFENLGMYKVYINGLTSDEQALYASRIITDCNNVLIARAFESGECNIFTEGEISFNEIFEKLLVIPNIQIGERYSVQPSKEDYMNTYNQYRRFPVADISKNLPSAPNMKDPQKQSRAQSVMKSIWIEKYPDSYKQFQPSVSNDDPAEIIQKEQELSNQKNN